jgi:competence protein ComFC
MLRRLFQGLINALYPKTCPSCKAKLNAQEQDSYICSDCRARIKKNTPPFCQRCGRHIEASGLSNSICSGCLKNKLNFDRAFSPCLYEGVIKELIHQFKYKAKTDLAKPLSEIMINFIKDYGLSIEQLDFIIPMPLHKTRLREREFNQAEELSKQISLAFNIEFSNNILMRNRHTLTQTNLPIEARFKNVENSFFVRKDAHIENRNFLLVDDVLTTGSTSSEAAKALKNAGANTVFVLTLAN